MRAAIGGTPYAARLFELLEEALAGETAESRACVAVRDTEIVGLVMYGEIAGTRGAAKLHLVAVTASARLQGVGGRLVDIAAADLARRGVRFVLAEVPDDPRVAPGRELLFRAGFQEESRVPDLYADGVALIFLRCGTRAPNSLAP
ncbi:MAG: GNAT family N-acetyltransferase [Gemmatimonadota bacterium]|nr:GNAT family N-acetyltransferase [Gemmatimonadota bacterium]